MDALISAESLVGTYEGKWELYGLDGNAKVVQTVSWTDRVEASNPTLNGGKVFIAAKDTMTYPNGETYTLEWKDKTGHLCESQIVSLKGFHRRALPN